MMVIARAALVLAMLPNLVSADLTRLVPESTISEVAKEVSGVAAKRNLDTLTLYHRTRASTQFRRASEHILGQLREYGFEDATILEHPADGETLFGTQRSRTAWNVEFAELWELDSEGRRVKRHASWDAMPLSVAQDSVSGKVNAALVDIGAGTEESDYAGKDIAGRLVLTESQPYAVLDKAVGEHGAAGIVSYAPNQKTAWWKEDGRLVRWGHLETYSDTRTFAFMISLDTARALRARLAAGEEIRFDAEVRASHSEGSYSQVTATIPGSDPEVGSDEIIYTCHLDHPRPGANDNVSGCVAILEVARTLKRLYDTGALPPPRRTLRFLWPAEIEGSIIYLAALEDASHIKANIHLDMVGGGAVTKSVFRISGGPMSLPSFIPDVGFEIVRWINDQTLRHASGEDADFPLVSAEGSRDPLLAQFEGIDLGSDHQVFNEGTWRIPGIYLHDWPDRYIHTNFDTASNIDPTKLKRAAFIAALQGWYLAAFDDQDLAAAMQLLKASALQRASERLLGLDSLHAADAPGVMNVHWDVERAKLESIGAFTAMDNAAMDTAMTFIDGLSQQLAPKFMPLAAIARDDRVYTRNPAIMGPMHGFGYSYLEDKLGKTSAEALALEDAQAYEALNLVDGKRTVSDIRWWLLAEFGPPIALEDVAEYLESLAEIDVVALD